MRQESPVNKPVVLSIAGSDSGGGAGIQADLKTIEAVGGFGTTAITSVTAQNTRAVERTHVLPRAEIAAQVDAVLADFDVGAVKTGLLATAEVVELVAEQVRETDAPAVVDPVMVAATGDRLLAREAEAAYEDLVAHSTLVTPNTDEAAVLTDVDPGTESEARAAGEQLVEIGADAALVKGGHLSGDDVVDVLVTQDDVETFRHPRVDTEATHGSGCTLSSAIATRLASGASLSVAVSAGIDLLSRAVRYNLAVGEGPGAVHHLVAARNDGARDATAETVQHTVDRLVDAGIDPLVPEVGTNVVGATPYAERPDEVAAVDGRIVRTLSGARPTGGIRFGASSHVASALLAAREAEPGLRMAATYRGGDRVQAALADAGVEVSRADRDDVDRSDPAGSGIPTTAIEAGVAAAGGSPVAVLDTNARGGELVYLFTTEGDELVETTQSVRAKLSD